MEIKSLEESAGTGKACVGGQESRVIDPRVCLDNGDAVVMGKKSPPPVQVRIDIVRDWAETRGVRAPQAVKKTVHENASGSHTGSNERHHPEKRLEVDPGDSLLKKGGLALSEQVREAIRGDAHGHVQCVEKNTEEDH